MSTRVTQAVTAVCFLGMTAMLLGARSGAVAAQADRWSVVLTTAAGQPQDVWVTGMGNNTVGWRGGGVLCLGRLADGVPEGQRATLQANVVQGGVIGPDGTPVAPGTYQFLDFDAGELIPYTVVAGQTFYVLLDIYVVESNFPVLPTGTRFALMFVFDAVLGNQSVPMFTFVNFGGGFEPFL